MTSDRRADLLALPLDGQSQGRARSGTSRADKLAYSVREAAEALAVSPDLVRRLIDTGELRAVRLAGRVVIPVVEVEDLLGIKREGPAPRQLLEAFARLVGADLYDAS